MTDRIYFLEEVQRHRKDTQAIIAAAVAQKAAEDAAAEARAAAAAAVRAEEETNKKKWLLKLVGAVVVNCMSKYGQSLERDMFKKHAKEVRGVFKHHIEPH
jgi:histone-lysine N-methyltransferase SETD2